jgi:hypothetical protein
MLSSHLRLGFTIKILKARLSSSTWPAHLNLLNLITLTILNERYKVKYLIVEPFLLPILIPPWALIFASGSYFQIP